jgi:hypothetical protein
MTTSPQTETTQLEVSLSRPKFLSLVKKLGESFLSMNVSRGRFTADGVWMRLEITGQKARLDEALRDCRSPS